MESTKPDYSEAIEPHHVNASHPVPPVHAPESTASIPTLKAGVLGSINNLVADYKYAFLTLAAAFGWSGSAIYFNSTAPAPITRQQETDLRNMEMGVGDVCSRLEGEIHRLKAIGAGRPFNQKEHGELQKLWEEAQRLRREHPVVVSRPMLRERLNTIEKDISELK